MKASGLQVSSDFESLRFGVLSLTGQTSAQRHPLLLYFSNLVILKRLLLKLKLKLKLKFWNYLKLKCLNHLKSDSFPLKGSEAFGSAKVGQLSLTSKLTSCKLSLTGLPSALFRAVNKKWNSSKMLVIA